MKFRSVCTSETFLYRSGACVVISNQCQWQECACCHEIDRIEVLLVGDPTPVCTAQHPEFSSACLCRTVLTIAYHSHQHHYGSSIIPTDKNR